MSEEHPTPPPPTAAEPERPAAVVSAQGALRLLLILLTIWTAFSGLALVFFQDGAAATIGGGLEGGEGEAAQRLLGVHLLVLAPIYGLLVWRPAQYGSLLWVPYAAQGGVVVVTAVDIITFDRDFSDGALPLIVAATFLALRIYVWRARTQPEALGVDEPEEPEAAEGEAPAGDQREPS